MYLGSEYCGRLYSFPQVLLTLPCERLHFLALDHVLVLLNETSSLPIRLIFAVVMWLVLTNGMRPEVIYIRHRFHQYPSISHRSNIFWVKVVLQPCSWMKMIWSRASPNMYYEWEIKLCLCKPLRFGVYLIQHIYNI